MKEELRQQWLWMVAVNFACEQLVKWTRRKVPDNETDTWQESVRRRYEYFLENWDEATASIISYIPGRATPDGRYCVGIMLETTAKGVEATFWPREGRVLVRWSEIRAFIQDMLKPDQQLSMFDLLLEGACS